MPAKNNNRGEGDQFAKFAGAVARQLLGEPNKALSSKDELRFGTHGSVSVDLTKGVYFDHSDDTNFGGVLKLIEWQTGQTVEGGNAVNWLRDNGYHVEDRGAPPVQQNSSQQAERKPARYDPDGNWLPPGAPDNARLTKVYPYTNPDGTVRYEVARFDWPVTPKNPGDKDHEKTFVQRVPDPARPGRYSYKVRGVEPLPYRLAELLEDIADGAEIFIPEGEKKVDMLRELGVPATCNSGGGGKFPEALAKWFRGAKVTILPDNDATGEKHIGKVAQVLDGVAARVRYLSIPDLPPKGGVDDWLPAGGTAERLYELAKTLARSAEATPFESKFAAVDWLDIDAPGVQHEWLVKKVLTRREVSMLAGPSQSGKTFLALDLALSVARGVDWFGHRTMQGGVVYCASESAVGVRRKRLPAYRRHYQVGAEAIPFTLLQKPLDLYGSDEDADALIEECAHWAREFEKRHGVGLEMIVIDTLAAVTPGWDENSSRDVGPVLARCARLRDATGAHVQLVHHMNAEGAKPRGHTSIVANIENVILVKKAENRHDADQRVIREAVVAKQKEEEDGAKIDFVLPSIQIGTDSDGDRITSCIVAKPAGEAGQTIQNPTAIQLGGANQKVLRALYEVLADQSLGLFAPPDLKLRSGALVATRKDHTARFFATEKPDDFEDKPEDEQKRIGDAARQALKRARDTLYQKGIIGLNEEFIWLTGKPVQGFGPPPGERQQIKRKKDAEPAEEKREALPFAEEDGFDPETFR